MLTTTLGQPGRSLTIVALGAHCDDIAIGCGGTLLRLLAERPGSTVVWVVFASTAIREAEERAFAREVVGRAGDGRVEIETFKDSFFPGQWAAIKERFEALKANTAPDLVLTHSTRDLHQDHRTIAELTWQTFRDHLIAEYEVPKYDADLGQPNVYVPLPEAIAHRKVELLMTHYRSQLGRSWFRSETFEALLRLRAIECVAPEGFAEALYVKKLVI